jgi:hypothetical protein
MKKTVALLLACAVALAFSGCSNDFEFADYPDDNITLTYEDNEYVCITVDNCPYAYDSGDMVYLFSLESGEFNDMNPAYNVYRHEDDEKPEYLFVVPKPSIRDMTPFAFVLKLS